MINNIFDSHAHYDDEAFNEDREILLNSLNENGVVNIMNIGYNLNSSRESVKLAEKYDFFYAVIGVHPQDASEYSEKIENELIILSKNSKVKAIGEIGLDYHYDDIDKDLQKDVFERQLILANKLNLPVVIHSRDAAEDTMDLLKKYKPQGIVHCYSYSAELAKEILKLGMYIGFTGVITFKNARKAVETAKIVPMDRLLVETDCPYMAPEPFRGKRCDSSMLQSTILKLSEIKEISPQVLSDTTNINAKTIFKI